MTRIFDNIALPLDAHLQETLTAFDHMDAAVGYFSLRGWRVFEDLVAEKPLGESPTARVLIGMASVDPHQETLQQLEDTVAQDQPLGAGPDGVVEADAPTARFRRDELVNHLRAQLMRGIPTPGERRTLRSLRQMLDTGQVQVKVFTRRPLHGKTYIFHRHDLNNPVVGFVGSSNLTASGLKHNYELNVDVVDYHGAQTLAGWFEDRWSDRFSLDVTSELLKLIDESWATPTPRAPYEVFLKVCYDLSRDMREGIAEFGVPREIDKILLPFQRTAVQILARRIMTQGGAMLGDVVGLGKTLTAIAVAMVLGEEGIHPLIVCPTNLVKMWTKHLHAYDIHGEVVPYSMADKRLPGLRRYQLVIIDESHTLRNPNRNDYRAVQAYIANADSKVLLLTATPYNLAFSDVGAQLGLYIDEDQDLQISPDRALREDPRIADQLDNQITTLKAFMKSDFPEDWQRLMNQHLIRRTRSFIRATAPKDENGREYLEFPNGNRFTFPTRVPRPRQHSFGADDPVARMTSEDTVAAIGQLTFPRYQLTSYLRRKITLTPAEQEFVNRTAQGRGHVAGFVRITFYKRLTSSGYAFIATLLRHKARNDLVLHALDRELPVPIGTIDDRHLSTAESDLAGEDAAEVGVPAIPGADPAVAYEALRASSPNHITWVRSEIFSDALARDLRADTNIVAEILNNLADWSPATDSKLQDLITLVATDHKADKVLVFTEYQDTAEYLKAQLVEHSVDHVAVVTGGTPDPTDVAQRFSPRSNAELQMNEAPDVAAAEEVANPVRVLISTDVLSEGQNLQDAHVVVNYDLPWAIIRLIQRAGRIDRIGQESEEVLVYTYFHDSLQNEIDIRQRIQRRLAANAQAFGSDERFFGSDDEVRQLTDLYNGQGLVDPAEVQDVDPVSLAHQYWIEAERDHPDITRKVEQLPDLIDATRAARDNESSGVLCYTRTESGLDGFGQAEAGDGPLRLISGHEALQLFKVIHAEPALPLRDDHDPLVKALVQGPLLAAAHTSGRLRGTRKRIWDRLNGHVATAADDVQLALDAVYQTALTGEADRRIRRAFRAGISPDSLAELLVSLHTAGDLVKSTVTGKDPIRIVSSMGVTAP